MESIDAYRAVAKRLELQDKVQMEERQHPPLKFPSAYVASGTASPHPPHLTPSHPPHQTTLLEISCMTALEAEEGTPSPSPCS